MIRMHMRQQNRTNILCPHPRRREIADEPAIGRPQRSPCSGIDEHRAFLRMHKERVDADPANGPESTNQNRAGLVDIHVLQQIQISVDAPVA
jgi:hypothetical protein